MYVLTQSLVNGSRSALATTAGLNKRLYCAYYFVGFWNFCSYYNKPISFFWYKSVGALYLLYLAYVVYKSDATLDFLENAPKKSYCQLFKQGVLMNLLNPKVMLFFLALFPQFLWEPANRYRAPIFYSWGYFYGGKFYCFCNNCFARGECFFFFK